MTMYRFDDLFYTTEGRYQAEANQALKMMRHIDFFFCGGEIQPYPDQRDLRRLIVPTRVRVCESGKYAPCAGAYQEEGRWYLEFTTFQDFVDFVRKQDTNVLVTYENCNGEKELLLQLDVSTD